MQYQRKLQNKPNARMEYKYYFRNVVQHYLVTLEGWPEQIDLNNFNDGSLPYTAMEKLLQKLRSGDIHWKRLTLAALEELEHQRDAQISHGDLEPPAPRRRRSDYRKKRKHQRQSHNNDNDDDDRSESSGKNGQLGMQCRPGVPPSDEGMRAAIATKTMRENSQLSMQRGPGTIVVGMPVWLRIPAVMTLAVETTTSATVLIS
jgi:hypothetical protein